MKKKIEKLVEKSPKLIVICNTKFLYSNQDQWMNQVYTTILSQSINSHRNISSNGP